MQDFQALFAQLPTLTHQEEGSYSALPIPSAPTHRIAKDLVGNPYLLITTAQQEDRQLLPQRLYNLRISPSMPCQVTVAGKITEDTFSTICCTSQEPELRTHFLQVAEVLIHNLGERPSTITIQQTIDKFVELFQVYQARSTKSVQGLWAELFIMLQATDPMPLMHAWHDKVEERYDFSFPTWSLEVKSTSGSARKHHFSASQLLPSPSKKCFVASIVAIPSTGGKHVYDLIEQLKKRFMRYPLLIEKLYYTTYHNLGDALHEAKNMRFDYQEAKDSLRIYASTMIPKIAMWPPHVSSVRFCSSLAHLMPTYSTLDLLLEDNDSC